MVFVKLEATLCVEGQPAELLFVWTHKVKALWNDLLFVPLSGVFLWEIFHFFVWSQGVIKSDK